MKERREFNASFHAFNISQVRAYQTVVGEEKQQWSGPKLFNDQKRECNDYFSQPYNKIYFEEKNKKVSQNLQVLKLCWIILCPKAL